MNPVSLTFLASCLALAGIGHKAYPQDGTAPGKTLLVHYMPWYASKPVSGKWGWHWTMNHFNPDKMDENGQRELATHDPPLIGPYDSGDPDALASLRAAAFSDDQINQIAEINPRTLFRL